MYLQLDFNDLLCTTESQEYFMDYCFAGHWLCFIFMSVFFRCILNVWIPRRLDTTVVEANGDPDK